MRISDWSSDVCSSDLADRILREDHAHHHGLERRRADVGGAAGAQQVDRDKGHYGGVEDSEDSNHCGQPRREPEKAADGAEINAGETGGDARAEGMAEGGVGDEEGPTAQKEKRG